jgi:hypothetical protein
MIQIYCTPPIILPVLEYVACYQYVWAQNSVGLNATLPRSQAPLSTEMATMWDSRESQAMPHRFLLALGEQIQGQRTNSIPSWMTPFSVVWIGYAMITGADMGCHLFGMGD